MTAERSVDSGDHHNIWLVEFAVRGGAHSQWAPPAHKPKFLSELILT